MPQSPDNLPLPLYSAAQVRELDARLIAAGTPGFILMNRAAEAVWACIQERWPRAAQVTILAGRGNNAGDGYLIARLAQASGWQARVLAVGSPEQLQGDAALARDEAVAAGVPVLPWQPGSELRGVLVDALLGTGLSGPVREPYRQAIEQINEAVLPVVAVDIPSGLCADTGSVLGVAVQAQLTVTFIGLKLGLFTGQAAEHVGVLQFSDLGAEPLIVQQHPYSAIRLTAQSAPQLPPRKANIHKGQLGHVLVVAGDRGYAGAGLLASQSALRSGAGLVSLATRREHVAASLARMPEVMAAGVDSANQLLALGAAATVWVVGPGMGQAAWARSLLSVASISPAVQVWDADALNLLAQGVVRLPEQAVLTPHPGETARLLGISSAEVQADRPAAAQALAMRYGQVFVLKGAGSFIATPCGELWLCERGHPVMAGAGLGDVLAGLIGSLLAQGMSTKDAACLAVYLHACAGESLSPMGRGLAASDLCAVIRELMQEHSACLK